jgi:hypothetical protein
VSFVAGVLFGVDSNRPGGVLTVEGGGGADGRWKAEMPWKASSPMEERAKFAASRFDALVVSDPRNKIHDVSNLCKLSIMLTEN